MKTIGKKLTVYLMILAILVTWATPALAVESAVEQAPASLAQLAQNAAETAMAYGEATSIQYALWQDGEITVQGTAGVYSKTENRLLTDDNLYGIGSISKIYTTAAMMKLQEQGKVRLDAPVTTYLPEFTMADPRYQEITVRMLLNHSSGLMGGTTVNAYLLADPLEDSATQDFLDRLADQRLQADPGAYSVYSNDSFTLAQLVIEQVSGMSFSDFLHTYLTEPLELDATFTPRDTFDTSLLAKTYLTGDDTRALPWETFAVIGTGGIYATASDLATFAGGLCDQSLLTQASFTAMSSEEYLRGMWPEDSEDDALAYGLGWDNVHMFPFNQNGIQALVKGGDTLVYHAGLVVLPEYHMAAAVLSSGGLSTYNQAAAAQILIDALAEQGVQVAADLSLPSAQPASMPASLTELSGSYGSSTGVVRVDVTPDGQLTLTMPASLGGNSISLQYYSDGSFRDAENSVLVKLVREENGQTYLYEMAYSPLTGLAPVCSAAYYYERLPENSTDTATSAAWQSRNGKLYLMANETYTSALYPFGGAFAMVALDPTVDGYLVSNPLSDANTALAFVQIPGTGSRDSGDIRILEEDGVEYLESNGSRYQDAGAAETIYTGTRSFCTVGQKGYARWYQVGEAAGKTMTVQLPEAGGFYVYDANFQLVASSWVFGDTTVVLPENGYIVFAGAPDSQFQISMS